MLIDDWNRQLEKIRKRINPYNREHNMFLRNFFKGTAELSLDSNNRMLIPKRLLDIIGAERDVVLAGRMAGLKYGQHRYMITSEWLLTILPIWLKNFWVGV